MLLRLLPSLSFLYASVYMLRLVISEKVSGMKKKFFDWVNMRPLRGRTWHKFIWLQTLNPFGILFVSSSKNELAIEKFNLSIVLFRYREV